jgi:hypothetical protein
VCERPPVGCISPVCVCVCGREREGVCVGERECVYTTSCRMHISCAHAHPTT